MRVRLDNLLFNGGLKFVLKLDVVCVRIVLKWIVWYFSFIMGFNNKILGSMFCCIDNSIYILLFIRFILINMLGKYVIFVEKLVMIDK